MAKNLKFGDIVFFLDGWSVPPRPWVGVVVDPAIDGDVKVRWWNDKSEGGTFMMRQTAQEEELTHVGKLPPGTELNW